MASAEYNPSARDENDPHPMFCGDWAVYLDLSWQRSSPLTFEQYIALADFYSQKELADESLNMLSLHSDETIPNLKVASMHEVTGSDMTSFEMSRTNTERRLVTAALDKGIKTALGSLLCAGIKPEETSCSAAYVLTHREYVLLTEMQPEPAKIAESLDTAYRTADYIAEDSLRRQQAQLVRTIRART